MDHRDERTQKRLWSGKVEALITLLATEASSIYKMDRDNTIRALNFLICGGGVSRKMKNESPLIFSARDFREYMNGHSNALGKILMASYNKTPFQDEFGK